MNHTIRKVARTGSVYGISIPEVPYHDLGVCWILSISMFRGDRADKEGIVLKSKSDSNCATFCIGYPLNLLKSSSQVSQYHTGFTTSEGNLMLFEQSSPKGHECQAYLIVERVEMQPVVAQDNITAFGLPDSLKVADGRAGVDALSLSYSGL